MRDPALGPIFCRRRAVWGLGLFALLTGCGPGVAAMDGGLPDLASAPRDLSTVADARIDLGGEGGLGCPTDKIAFSQIQGCANDGSVEFCLPAGDQTLRQRVLLIDSGIACQPGGGRAACNTMTEVLCFLPTTGPATCVTPRGAMTDAAWRKVCQIAAFPEVRRVVPTIFE